MARRSLWVKLLLAASTLAVVSGLPWVKAKEGQTCKEACALGCLEGSEHYPSEPEDLLDVLEASRTRCNVLVSEHCPKHHERLDDGMKAEDLRAALRRAAAAGCGAEADGGGEARYTLSLDSGGRCAVRRWAASKTSGACAAVPEERASQICACAPFDCVAGLPNWHEGWSPAKKKWCCSNKQLGCEDVASAKKTEEDSSDCHAGQGDWGEVWSVGPHKWCCAKSGVGCLEISNVSGLDARYASGTMTVKVGQARRFVDDPSVLPLLRRGIARVVGTDVRVVSVRLSLPRGGEGGVRGAGNSVLLEYMVPVPAGEGVSKASPTSGPMALAVMSADQWSQELEQALEEAQGGYIVSVASVSEVALSNVRTVPMPEEAGSGDQGLLLLFGLLGLVLVGVGMIAYTWFSKHEDPRDLDLSPTKSPSRRALIEEAFKEAAEERAEKAGEACSPKEKLEEVFEEAQKEHEEAVQEAKEQPEEPQAEEVEEEEEEEEAEEDQKEEEKQKEADKKKKRRCLPDSKRMQGCVPRVGPCASKKGAMEPTIAGAQQPSPQ